MDICLFISWGDSTLSPVMIIGSIVLLLLSDTAEHVKEVVEEVMKEWEIPENKVNVIVTDNGSNMVAAFKSHFEEEMKKKTEEEEMDVDIGDTGEDEDDLVFKELCHDIAHSSNVFPVSLTLSS